MITRGFFFPSSFIAYFSDSADILAEKKISATDIV